jgi:RNA polymerase sigma factor (sigma-70 family)
MSDSTTFWLQELKAGNKDAAQELWQRYYRRLVTSARKRVRNRLSRSIVDESDIAQSAFACFYRAAQVGRFPQLNDRNDFWRVLLTITDRRIVDHVRREQSLKRRIGRFDEESPRAIDVYQLVDGEPTPEFCAMAMESVRNLMEQLKDSRLRLLALRKMEGYTNEELARQFDCSVITVERKLRRIRHIWTSAAAAGENDDA